MQITRNRSGTDQKSHENCFPEILTWHDIHLNGLFPHQYIVVDMLSWKTLLKKPVSLKNKINNNAGLLFYFRGTNSNQVNSIESRSLSGGNPGECHHYVILMFINSCHIPFLTSSFFWLQITFRRKGENVTSLDQNCFDSQETSIVHNLPVIWSIVSKFCTDTVVLCAKFENELTTNMGVMNEQVFARFGLNMRVLKGFPTLQ